MGEAERALQRRQQAELVERIRAEERRKAELAAYRRGKVAEMRHLVDEVLAALKAADYPYSQSISIKTRFGRPQRAAWVVIPGVTRDDWDFDPPIYLLSDGRFNFGGTSYGNRAVDLQEMADLTGIERGLRALQAKLKAR